MNNKKLSRLLEPNLKLYFLCLLVFALSVFLDLSPVLFVVLCAAAGIFFTKVGLRGK